MSSKPSNGRIDLGRLNQTSDYPIYAEATTTPHRHVADVSKGNIAMTPVSELFFSETNILALQSGIKNMILNKSCGKYNVGNQSTSELLIIMRAIYLKQGVNSIVDVVGQVRKLNESVLLFSVPRIMSELEMRDVFIKDISALPIPMRYGESTSVAGTKTLELKPFF